MIRHSRRAISATPRLSINITFDVFNFNLPANHDCGIMEIFVAVVHRVACNEYKINFLPKYANIISDCLRFDCFGTAVYHAL